MARGDASPVDGPRSQWGQRDLYRKEPKRATVCDAPVNLLSLFPTLLDLCKLPAKQDNDGPSLLPLLRDPLAADWNHDSVTFLSKPGSYAVSGRSHRYIHYADGSEELYDIRTDPYEWTNLAVAVRIAGSVG